VVLRGAAMLDVERLGAFPVSEAVGVVFGGGRQYWEG
jgi:hypothetical protein